MSFLYNIMTGVCRPSVQVVLMEFLKSLSQIERNFKEIDGDVLLKLLRKSNFMPNSGCYGDRKENTKEKLYFINPRPDF